MPRLVMVGRSREGHTVVRGTFDLRATHGLSVDAVLGALWGHHALPDWCDLVADMLLAGSPIEHVRAALVEATCDVNYPDDVRAGVLGGLEALFAAIDGMTAQVAATALRRASASLGPPGPRDEE